jgi:hypothetical protein
MLWNVLNSPTNKNYSNVVITNIGLRKLLYGAQVIDYFRTSSDDNHELNVS